LRRPSRKRWSDSLGPGEPTLTLSKGSAYRSFLIVCRARPPGAGGQAMKGSRAARFPPICAAAGAGPALGQYTTKLPILPTTRSIRAIPLHWRRRRTLLHRLHRLFYFPQHISPLALPSRLHPAVDAKAARSRNPRLQFCAIRLFSTTTTCDVIDATPAGSIQNLSHGR
jgi:hypothetical protein